MVRLLPRGLAGRFALLLGAALVFANLVAMGLLLLERAQRNSAAAIEREIERAVSLVPAIEATAPAGRSGIARSSSTPLSRLSIDPEPIIELPPTAPRSAALSRALAEVLPGRDVRAAIVVRPARNPQARPRETVAVSVALRTPEGAPAQWLNIISRRARSMRPNVPEEIFLLILGVSLLSVLGVGLLFVRRLTRPLSELAEAARAAGRGDRSVRVAEAGPLELREAAAAFNDMQTRIGQFDAERMRTLAAVGHDLRTPITSLRIRAELLSEAEAAPMLRTLHEMAVMADGLVAFAKGTGEGEGVQEIELHPLLAQVCEARSAQFLGGADARVLGRPVALGRAVGNLIDNALRYGGAARVSTRRDRQSVLIKIEDDGPGIAEDKLSEIFEPFVRGEDSRNAETGGAGLGLAIARNIALSHGGHVMLQNRAEGGLRATLALPIVGGAAW